MHAFTYAPLHTTHTFCRGEHICPTGKTGLFCCEAITDVENTSASENNMPSLAGAFNCHHRRERRAVSLSSTSRKFNGMAFEKKCLERRNAPLVVESCSQSNKCPLQLHLLVKKALIHSQEEVSLGGGRPK
ncbi:hypothetical protein MAR_006160 [Mya arenaria]|uniref:Uncharacterized protein n=1 Tax=Mya arenaria TaxID=6604 RepID=A0ABY7D7P3_MYAAR|nr:hypothetical protein MAR_006160 [Mya arenaria]